MRLVSVVAMDHHRCVGKDGDLPWRLRGDMRHFRETTMGTPVIMGRKTWDSLPAPLQGRTQIVLSGRAARFEDGSLLAGDWKQALRLAEAHLGDHRSGNETAHVVGGAAVYALAMKDVAELIVTEVDCEVEGGDAWFPVIRPEQWRPVSTGEWSQGDGDEHRWRLVRYLRT